MNGFRLRRKKNKEPVPEKNQSPPKRKDGKPTKKHTHKKSVRDEQWRENMPCSSIDKKINRQKDGASWNLKACTSITTMHAEARVCTSSFHTHNHHHACMALSLFSDAQYAQVSGNKKLIDRVLTKDVRESLAQWAREEMEKLEKPGPIQQEKLHLSSADEEDLQVQHKKIFKDYTSIPIILMSEEAFEAKTKDPLKVQEARQIMTAMAKAKNLKQGKGNGSFSFNH